MENDFEELAHDHVNIPKDFLKDITLVPQNFDQPEKPVHGQIVHSQLKQDLFNLTYNKIRGLLYGKLSHDDDFFRLKEIKKVSCEGDEREKFLTEKYRTSHLDKFVSCEDWTVEMTLHKKSGRNTSELEKEIKLFNYKVKVLHGVHDHYYSILIPPNFWQTFKAVLKYGQL